MAGDWIKVEKSTRTKPEVGDIAQILNIHVDHAFGLCVRFWCWCDDHLSTCNARVTEKSLDSLLGHSGFAQALISVGWLQARSDSLVIPNFDRHLSQTAKRRSLTSHRVAEHRQRKSNDTNVTSALTRGREENKAGSVPRFQGRLSDDGAVIAFGESSGLPADRTTRLRLLAYAARAQARGTKNPRGLFRTMIIDLLDGDPTDLTEPEKKSAIERLDAWEKAHGRIESTTTEP